MELRAVCLVTVLTTAAAVVVAAAPAGAAASCSPVEQITTSTGGSFSANIAPALDADGDRIAFQSNRDLTGGNADLNTEIFLADLTADTMTQVTATTGGGAGNSSPRISDDGTRTVFISAADLTAENPDSSSELFLFEPAGPTLSQITDFEPTDEIDGDVNSAAISGDGTTVAFTTDADPLGTNADGSTEVYRASSTGAPAYLQVTTSPDPGTSTSTPALDDTGDRITFIANADLVPTGNADLNPEVFVWDETGPATIQLTSTTAPVVNASPTLSENGLQVVFTSTGNLGGGNGDGNAEVFRRTVSSSTTTRLTGTTTGNQGNPRTDQVGRRVVFATTSSDLPRNADGNSESMVLDVGVGGPGALTATTGTVFAFPAISDDGAVVAFSSTADPLGTNPDGNQELFLGRCGPVAPTFTDVPTTNVFYGQIQWMEELGIASGFPGGLFKPQDAVKRQQMANFMYNLAGQPAFTPPVTPTFSDVPTSNPFYLQVEWMAAEGIASGFPGGLFKPQDAVKRQQMANFMYNLAGQPLFGAPASPTFTDVPTSNPFFLQVEWMADETIASGFPGGLFEPQDPVKRQQMANFMHAFAVSPGEDV